MTAELAGQLLLAAGIIGLSVGLGGIATWFVVALARWDERLAVLAGGCLLLTLMVILVLLGQG